MKKTLVVLLVVAGVLLAACGGGGAAPATQAPAAGGQATQAPAAPAAGGGTLKIVSSLPLTGSSLTQTDTIVKSIQLKLKQIKNQVCGGKYNIVYQSMDDASAALGKWDPAVETENANKAAADKSVIAYIGTFNSGAAALSIPILNKANVVMVSPANTNPGLTKPGKGDPKKGEPDVYYPNGKRNYARVVAADDIQGAAGANWAKELGAKSVFILDDTQLYGKGIADVFDAKAKEIGLNVLGREGIDGKAADYRALAAKILDLKPDLVYYGGITQNNAGQLWKDIKGEGFTGMMMGPDGISEDAFIEAAGADVAEGTYTTFGGVPPDKLTGTAGDWYKAYKAKYNSEPQPYAIYGYESANVVLAAINKVCEKDRAKIRDAVFATKDFQGVLGTWSFDANGDTTLTTMSGSQVKGGKFQFVQAIK